MKGLRYLLGALAGLAILVKLFTTEVVPRDDDGTMAIVLRVRPGLANLARTYSDAERPESCCRFQVNAEHPTLPRTIYECTVDWGWIALSGGALFAFICHGVRRSRRLTTRPG